MPQSIPRRQSTGKRLRFEVFKRDAFTCQYCGAQPPDAVLVADHISPVSAGGPTSIDNLITACETCNQGKAARPLGARSIRPDADLLYLEAQQEIAELRRYQAVAQERNAVLAEIVASLQDGWYDASGLDWAPSDGLVRQLLGRYSPEIVDAAMADVAVKLGTGYLRSSNHRWISYLHAVARNLAEEEGD